MATTTRSLNPENRTFTFSVTPDVPAAPEGAPRRFAGVGYTGDVIPRHWFWGDVVFDLSQMSHPPKMPMLLNHDPDKIAGYADTIAKTDKGLEVSGPLIRAPGMFGQYVADSSDQGFPWQMSVNIDPSTVEEVMSGSVTVNGRTFSAPLTVFRQSTLSEVSFCPVGYDSGTSATALSRANQGAPAQQEGVLSMDEKEIAAIKAENEALKAGKSAIEADVVRAQSELKEFRRTQRSEQVKTLFSKVGAPFDENDIQVKTLLEMEESAFLTAFALVESVAQRQSARNPALFSDTAVSGTDPAAKGESPLVAEARRRTQAAK